VLDFECGRLSINDYLAAVVFHQPRSFSPDEFQAFMCSRSTSHREMLEMVAALAQSKRYLLATLNNESTALNRHRIDTYHLDRLFTAFFSSCYLGATKPGETIFRRALQIAHRRPDECLFIDDRTANVEAARRAGIAAIHFTGQAALSRSLAEAGVTGVK
jgi:putative hydrolase of the HAD superfamily